MIPPSTCPALGNVMQTAWVTPNLDHSLEQFSMLYGIPDFLVMEQKFEAEVFGETDEMHLRMALANVDDMQFELIEPMGGGIDRIYRDVLPRDGSHANVFHHICVKVTGTLDDWEAHLRNLSPERPVVYRGNVGDDIRFVYTDDRPFLGHYVEHVWLGPETEARMAVDVPTFRTMGGAG